MVVAVSLVDAMQMPFHEVVDVIAVGNGGVAAAGTVDVRGVVGGTRVPGRARAGVRGIDGNRALVDVVSMGVVKMPVVEIVGVVPVPDRGMSAGGVVHVIVIVMLAVIVHDLTMVGLAALGQGREVLCPRA
jgi:hypothetical protein